MSTLEDIGQKVRASFETKNQARERILAASREIIRLSANTIRAVHRGEFELADSILERAKSAVLAVNELGASHPDIFNAGFVQDAQKEYAEAWTTRSLVAGGDFPDPDDLHVGYVPYMNGLGDVVGELRRHLLDSLRGGDVERVERVMGIMDEIYGLMVTLDYPDALTGGLRRTTDKVRGTMERTRGDLTIAVRQRHLEQVLKEVEDSLAKYTQK